MNEFIALVVLLFFSGVFSGSEAALVALTQGRVEGLLKEGRGGAQALSKLKSDPSQMLITILIGNNLVNIAASALATVIATEWFGRLGPGIAVGVLTIVILIFGEITPKSLATRYAERISLFIAPPMLGFMRLIYPLVWIFGQFTTWVHQTTVAQRDPTVTESEIIGMVGYGEAEGTIDSEERRMIERVFEFNDLEAADVMTPRSQIFALNSSASVGKVLREATRSGYTRIPLFEIEPDKIYKVVYLRDILEAYADGHTKMGLSKIAHTPLFVPENQSIVELFAILRGEKRRLAVVLDEFGVAQGIVTLEDVLEELVGEIYDEDEKQRAYKLIDEDTIEVDGTIELRVVEDYFDTELPGKPTDTVSRWVLNHVERIPQEDEQFTINDLVVTVAKASHHRIRQIVLHRPPVKRSGTRKAVH